MSKLESKLRGFQTMSGQGKGQFQGTKQKYFTPKPTFGQRTTEATDVALLSHRIVWLDHFPKRRNTNRRQVHTTRPITSMRRSRPAR